MTKYERIPFSSEMLRSFIAIAQCNHLTIAAHELNRTQSALSVHLRKMEEALGTKLFSRHAKGMTLTPEGEKLLPAAHRILSEMQRVQGMFSQPLQGQIRVGIPDHYDDMIFETVLADFGKANPEVDVTVTSGCSSGFSAAISTGRMDLAVVSSAQSAEGDVLETEATHWVESSHFEYDPDRPLPLAVLDRGCWWSKIPENALLSAKRSFRTTFRSSSFSNLRCAIRAGLGIGVLPARALQNGMRIADNARGLPPLPAMTRSLLISPYASKDITEAMSVMLRAGLAQRPSS